MGSGDHSDDIEAVGGIAKNTDGSHDGGQD
jgi:hypothetical protein